VSAANRIKITVELRFTLEPLSVDEIDAKTTSSLLTLSAMRSQALGLSAGGSMTGA
jgi:hypothetical protein